MTQINTDFTQAADHLAAVAYFEGYNCPPIKALYRWIRDEISGANTASTAAATSLPARASEAGPNTVRTARGRPRRATASTTSAAGANVSEMPVAGGPYFYAAAGYTGALTEKERRLVSYLNANPGSTRQQIVAALNQQDNVIGKYLGHTRDSLITKGAVQGSTAMASGSSEAATRAA